MKVLIFDTETTGLPKSRKSAEQGPNNWPHMVSISWIVLDTDSNTELNRESFIIRPEWKIPEDSIAIHGITQERAEKEGVSLFEVMAHFITESCDMWVAHNLEFDMGVIVNAVLWDLKIQFPGTPQRKMCTMRLSKNICKLPGKFGYKMPKLKELYYAAFAKYPIEAHLHTSMYDVEVLAEVIKHYLPLRQAMNLVASSVVEEDGVQDPKTLRIRINNRI
jgi:DNA polymerase III subunit epsilon